jgi:hypothetical protein
MGPSIGSKPPDSSLSRDPTHVALHYLCLTRLKHEKPAVAWWFVGEAWGLKKHAVKWLIACNSMLARTMLQRLSGDPDQLLGLCEQYAREGWPDRGQSDRTTGDAPSRPARRNVISGPAS